MKERPFRSHEGLGTGALQSTKGEDGYERNLLLSAHLQAEESV